MSLVQKLITENYGIPYTRRNEPTDSSRRNKFLFALEVPSEASIGNPSIEEHDNRCPCRRYSPGFMDDWLKDEYHTILVLSLEDIDNVRKKWRKIKNDPTTFGTLLMITLLNDAPDTAAKMPANPGVLYNGVMVYDNITMTTAKQTAQLINKIIKYIHLPEYVTSFTHACGIGMSFNKTKLDKKDFEALHSAIIKTVTTYYKMDNTPKIIASLKKTLWITLGLIEDASHWNDFGQR